MKKVVIHIFHDDAASLGTGSHVPERIRQVMGPQDVALEVHVLPRGHQFLRPTGPA